MQQSRYPVEKIIQFLSEAELLDFSKALFCLKNFNQKLPSIDLDKNVKTFTAKKYSLIYSVKKMGTYHRYHNLQFFRNDFNFSFFKISF